MEETKVNERIVRKIVLLKRLLLQINEGYCMGTDDKKHLRVIQFGNNALYPFGYMGKYLHHAQHFDNNSRKSSLDGLYLQSVGLKCSEKEWQ